MKKNEENKSNEINKIREPYKAAGTYTYEKTERRVRTEETSGNALPFRVLAILCYIIAIASETAAVLFISGKPESFEGKSTWFIVLSLVLDLIFVILGSSFWKKGNRLRPVSEKNRGLFFLSNNLGFFAATLAFWPFVLVALSGKRIEKKTKLISVLLAFIGIAAEVLAVVLR